MSLISRITTWTIGQVLKAADQNGEFNNIVNILNNLDAATTSWTNVKTGILTSTGTTTLKGTTTNDSAATGNIGEYVESIAVSANTPATNTYGDATSISLTAGDWDVTGLIEFNVNTATWTQVNLGISTTTGNSATGLVVGSNLLQMPFASSNTTPLAVSMVIPAYRISIASTTIVYLKMRATFSLGQASHDGARLSARRVR